MAGSASPAALVAPARTEYTPSGSAAPSSSLPPHVASAVVPAPPTWRTSLPAASRISTVHAACSEQVNPKATLSRTPSALGLMLEAAALKP